VLAISSGVALHGESTDTVRERGFSLLEILAATAIAGVLLAIGYPRLSTLLTASRLDGAVRALAADLQKSRLRAIAEGKCVRLTFDSAAGTYQVASKAGVTPCGSDGFANEGPPRKIDEGSALRVAATASPTFDPRGRASTTSVMTLTAPDGATRLAAVNAVGRVNVQ